MLAKELLSENMPVLTQNDTGIKALNWMEMFKVNHLPVVSNGDFLHLISDDDIYEHNIGENQILGFPFSPYKPFVYQNQHIYEIIDLAAKQKLSTIPVLDESNKFVGIITVHELTDYMSRLLATSEYGGIIELSMPFNDYSATEISNIVENNGLKILSMYVSQTMRQNHIKVTLKLNSYDFTSLISSFERYDYNISATFLHHDQNEEIYEDRYENLLNFIDF